MSVKSAPSHFLPLEEGTSPSKALIERIASKGSTLSNPDVAIQTSRKRYSLPLWSVHISWKSRKLVEGVGLSTRKHIKFFPHTETKRPSSKPTWNGMKLHYFVLLTIVAGLGTSLWNWRDVPYRMLKVPTAKDMTQLDAIVKRTSKEMEMQLKIANGKLGNQIANLRRDIDRALETESLAISNWLQSVKFQVNDIEQLLAKQKHEGLLTREDMSGLIDTVLHDWMADGMGGVVTLNDIRVAAKHIVEKEVEKHARDGMGRRDFALASGGGRVLDHSEVYFHSKTCALFIGFLSKNFHWHPRSKMILEPSFGEPGHCLPLKGSNVYVDIRLRTSIHPDGITLEHVSKSVAYDLSSAPKDFRVIGWRETSPTESTAKALLGEYTYNLDQGSLQTFNFRKVVREKLVNTIRLHVLTNHGSLTHSCIYRVRLHGSLPEAPHP